MQNLTNTILKNRSQAENQDNELKQAESFLLDVESVECGKRLQALADNCKTLLEEVRQCLELATDSSVDLANENLALRETIERMKVGHNIAIKKLIDNHGYAIADLTEKFNCASIAHSALYRKLQEEHTQRVKAEEVIAPLNMDDKAVYQLTMR